MIKVGDYGIEPQELNTKAFFEQLKSEDSETLAKWLIDLANKHEDLHQMNDSKHSVIMSQSKSIGGVTVFA